MDQQGGKVRLESVEVARARRTSFDVARDLFADSRDKVDAAEILGRDPPLGVDDV